jgi:hypothetical protein
MANRILKSLGIERNPIDPNLWRARLVFLGSEDPYNGSYTIFGLGDTAGYAAQAAWNEFKSPLPSALDNADGEIPSFPVTTTLSDLSDNYVPGYFSAYICDKRGFVYAGDLTEELAVSWAQLQCRDALSGPYTKVSDLTFGTGTDTDAARGAWSNRRFIVVERTVYQCLAISCKDGKFSLYYYDPRKNANG